MSKSNRSVKLIYRALLTGVLVSFLWLQSLTSSALAMPIFSMDNTYLAQARTDVDTIKPKPEAEKRSEAIKECLPPALAAIDIGERVERALGSGSSQRFVDAFDLKDHPEFAEEEKSFEDCLKTKGVIPAEQAA